ncbi:hypothetical protein GCM10022236_02070 [Microlunatus ginsengisoli]|uniref:Uncharacterized protein n=1 Tax=Microlunatus ginsengisoli TaxID=363863 RepID=A0ABP6ZC28_9ACTN
MPRVASHGLVVCGSRRNSGHAPEVGLAVTRSTGRSIRARSRAVGSAEPQHISHTLILAAVPPAVEASPPPLPSWPGYVAIARLPHQVAAAIPLPGETPRAGDSAAGLTDRNTRGMLHQRLDPGSQSSSRNRVTKLAWNRFPKPAPTAYDQTLQVQDD